MRRILTALVATAAIAGFAGSALACGNYKTASNTGAEIATTGQTAKPVQQTQIPSGSSQ